MIQLDAYDLFCKIDDDDLYSPNYIEDLVNDYAKTNGIFQAHSQMESFLMKSGKKNVNYINLVKILPS